MSEQSNSWRAYPSGAICGREDHQLVNYAGVNVMVPGWEERARLIAAAPELLEALQLAEGAAYDADAMADVWPAIRAAIAKATGS